MADQNRVAAGFPVRVLGVDACTKGWVGLADDLRAYFGRTIPDLLAAAAADGTPAVVAVDIPIGLPTVGPRRADQLARGFLGRRASSVFSTPIRAALAATTHAEATALSVRATGKGLSQQAYALGPKILEVDRWARTTPYPVIEIHPEVSFATMARRTLNHPKSTWAGAQERRPIPDAAGITQAMAPTPAAGLTAPATRPARKSSANATASPPSPSHPDPATPATTSGPSGPGREPRLRFEPGR